MKKTYLRHCFSKHPASIIAIIISQFTLLPMANAVEISINGSDDLKLVGSITYDFQSTPRSISFQVDVPFVCTSIDATDSPTVLGVNDANDVPITTLNGGILAYEHNLTSDRINLITDGSIQCAGRNGLQNEVVLKHGFESGDLKITFLDTNGDIFPVNIEVSDQQTFVYQYIVENTGDVTLGADLVEFFKVDASQPFFSDAPDGDDWVCSISGGTTTSCGDVASGEATVNLTNAIVEPGEQLSIIVTRVVEIPDGTVGTNIELLSAIFVTDGDDNATNNNSIFQVFGTTDNNQPTISPIDDTMILEDESTLDIDFVVTDVETDDGSLIVTATSSSSSVVSPASIVLAGSGSNRTIQITPIADANTAAMPVTITVTVDDGITTVNEQFELTVTPVNDMPTFSLQIIPDWPAGTPADQNQLKGFVENLSLGASTDEATQSIINSSVVVREDPNEILTFVPQLSNSGVLGYVLSGIGGEAIIDIVLQDGGGTDDGGDDTSEIVTFTITVLNTLPVISAVANQVFDEDNSSSVIEFMVSDVETDFDDLIVSASSSDESIIQIAGIDISATGETRTVQITPVADQNTVTSGDVVITLIVDDGSNTSETSFNVTINPINDAPTFDIGEDIIWPIGTIPPGFIQQAGFASNVQMGPTTDENNTQVVDEFIETISGDAIFVPGFFPAIDVNGGLAYALNGTVSGVAIVEVVLQDSGGVLNGGVDLSMKRTFRIVVQQ